MLGHCPKIYCYRQKFTAIFSLVRPDSWTRNGARGAAWYKFAHLGISQRMLKIHMSMMAKKNRHIKFSKRVQKIFYKNFFLTKNVQKTSIFGYFWSKNGRQKFLKTLRQFLVFLGLFQWIFGHSIKNSEKNRYFFLKLSLRIVPGKFIENG